MSLVGPLSPGFLAGFFLGRVARKALSKAMLIAGGAIVLVFLLGRFGVDTSTMESWLQAGSSWAGERLEGVKQYLAALAPTAAAVGVGFKVGLGRKVDQDRDEGLVAKASRRRR
jgi:uncharacterized membrane protein (Fun14 family)